MNCGHHLVTKFTLDEKTQATKKNKMFKRFGQINDQIYEAEFIKSGIEQKEPIIVGFFTVQNAKWRKL